MANILDIFSVGFSSEELQEFNKTLKSTKNDLDKAEKKVSDLEEELNKLEQAETKDAKAIEKTKTALEQARGETKRLKTSLENMQKSSTASMSQIQKSSKNIVKSLGAIIAITATLKKSLEFYEQAEQLEHLSQSAGVAVEKLQQLGNVSKRFGGDVEGVASMSESLRQKDTKEKYLKAGVRVAVNADKSVDVEQTMENVARRMEKFKTDTEKLDFANSLGIDEGTTRVLIQGVERYREELKRAEKYRLYTKEDIERMRDYRQIQNDIRMGIDRIYSTIARVLLPALTQIGKVVRGVTDWLAGHEGLIKIVGVTLGIAVAITTVIGVVNGLNMAFKFLMANHVVLWILAISVAIAAVITVINDLIVFMQGGESIIGEILKKFGVDTDKLRENIKGFFANLQQWITSAIEWLTSLGGKISELIGKVKTFWDSIPDPLKKLIGLSNPLTAGFTLTSIAKEKLAQANNNPLNTVPSGAISNYNTTNAINQTSSNNAKEITSSTSNKRTTNIGTINVQTKATNGAEVADYLQEISQFDDGLSA